MWDNFDRIAFMNFFIKIIFILSFFTAFLYGETLVQKFRIGLPKSPQNKVGTVISATGDASVDKYDQPDREHLLNGDEINNGDIITQYAGETRLKFVGGASLIMRSGSRLVITKGGIGQAYGDVTYDSGKRTLAIDTYFAKLQGANSNLAVTGKEPGLLNSYSATPDTVAAFKGNVRIRTTEDIDIYTIKYKDTGKVVTARNFILKQGEKAIFDGENVTIIKINQAPMENRKGTRHYLGFYGSEALLSRSAESPVASKKETKLITRIGFTYGIMDGRLDPMYFINFTTDPEMDELSLDYIVPDINAFQEFWFNSTPYIKYTVGIGRTYSDGLYPTHTALGIGVGAFLRKSMNYIFTDINYRHREWRFERSGNDEEWSENELTLDFKYVYRF